MQNFSVDLHIHSLHSPCADLYMSPKMIADRCQAVGLQAIAVCDHNSLRQLPVVAQCCQQRGIHLFYGVEITTQEELHLVALLPNWEACLPMQEYVDTHI